GREPIERTQLDLDIGDRLVVAIDHATFEAAGRGLQLDLEIDARTLAAAEMDLDLLGDQAGPAQHQRLATTTEASIEHAAVVGGQQQAVAEIDRDAGDRLTVAGPYHPGQRHALAQAQA